ncbi:hypothetical protein Sango_2922000 [Sesamum angolense]|uniref:Uncharacterized protein n=1 Tax=Sesamum angolense TaxID=2727404 RepID=A0AAE1T447_9LAMI|nr:hypothetical protein Sango_2922000 [Sesamum angolense]
MLGHISQDRIKRLVDSKSLEIDNLDNVPAYTRRGELLLEESSEAPQSNAGTSSAPIVSTYNVPILRRSARMPQPPERYKSRRMLGMTQNSYVEKVLKRFKMEHSKQGFLPMRHGVELSKKQSPKTDEKLKRMLDVLYAPTISNMFGEAHWTVVKIILKYLRRTKDMFLVYNSRELILEGYSNTSFQSDDDDAESQLGFVFKLNGRVVAWKSSKKDITTYSTI